jgi:hypothetical protein
VIALLRGSPIDKNTGASNPTCSLQELLPRGGGVSDGDMMLGVADSLRCVLSCAHKDVCHVDAVGRDHARHRYWLLHQIGGT